MRRLSCFGALVWAGCTTPTQPDPSDAHLERARSASAGSPARPDAKGSAASPETRDEPGDARCSHRLLEAIAAGDELVSSERLADGLWSPPPARFESFSCEKGEKDDACRVRIEKRIVADDPAARILAVTMGEAAPDGTIEAEVEVDGRIEHWRVQNASHVALKAKTLAKEGRRVTLRSIGRAPGPPVRTAKVMIANPDASALPMRQLLVRLHRRIDDEVVTDMQRLQAKVQAAGFELREYEPRGGELVDAVIGCTLGSAPP